MTTPSPDLSPLDASFDALIARLAKGTSEPTPSLPSTRCLSGTSIRQAIARATEEVVESGELAPPSIKACIERLLNMGLLHKVPIEAKKTARGSLSLYLLELGIQAPSETDPKELLQASVPNGVICYFTAIEFHELTTQLPSHHHISLPTQYASRSDATTLSTPPAGRGPSRVRARDPLGTCLFSFQGVPYYRTNRDRALILGVKTHLLHPRAMARITTLEQTLIDTLHKPMSCGGPSVVFEAWETALARLDQDRLADHLRRLDRPLFTRRVGWMLDRFQYHSDRPLEGLLSSARKNINRRDPTEVAPLFHGYAFESMDERWLLQVP